MQGWQADEVRGRVAPGETLEMRWPALGATLPMRVLSVDVGRQLVVEAGRSRLTLSFEPGRVHLLQDGVMAGDDAEGVESSWKVSLGLLAHYLEHHDGTRRHVAWCVRPARTTAAAAHLFFTEGAALRTWLVRTGDLSNPSAPARLRLSWGETLTGRLLSSSPGRDVAVSWSEQDESALVLRTLPSPRSRTERLIALAWSHWNAPPPAAAARDLERAIDRLAQVLDAGGAA
jgi:hypothetical protein